MSEYDDWFGEGYVRVLKDIKEIIEEEYGENGDAHSAARSIYCLLSDLGFIDYDVEKEIFYEWKHG